MKLTEVPEDLTLNAAVAMSAHGLSREPAGADGSESCLCGATPDDWDAHLAEVALAAVLPAHERQVREQVAAETYATATYDAARQQADDDPGHEDHCEWHINDHSYCSCRIWPAACAGVSIAAERIAESARGES